MTTHLPPPNDLDSEYGGPVSSFQSYSAEGDNLAKQGDYRKAVEAYSKVRAKKIQIFITINLLLPIRHWN